jgi:hypothetical protein
MTHPRRRPPRARPAHPRGSRLRTDGRAGRPRRRRCHHRDALERRLQLVRTIALVAEEDRVEAGSAEDLDVTPDGFDDGARPSRFVVERCPRSGGRCASRQPASRPRKVPVGRAASGHTFAEAADGTAGVASRQPHLEGNEVHRCWEPCRRARGRRARSGRDSRAGDDLSSRAAAGA